MTPDGEAIFLGADGEALAAHVHGPTDGQVRACVLICPPLGFDAVSAHPALFMLARKLADSGLLALRLDYHGTGDSSGHFEDDDRLRAWIQSIRLAVSELKTHTGAAVFIVGVSIGALLASHSGVGDGLVLWEPPPSGRGWLRGQHALARLGGLSSTASRRPGIHAPGYVYGETTAAELGGLDLTQVLAQSTSVPRAIVTGSDSAPSPWDSGDPNPPHVHASAEPNGFLGISPILATAPRQTVELITSLLRDWSSPQAYRPVVHAWPTSAVVSGTSSEPAVMERHVVIGEHKLPAVVTENPAGGPSSDAPVVVFLPTGAEHCLGPGRSWVELSRRWAREGRRSVRLDLRGIGERANLEASSAGYPSTAMADVEAALTELHQPGSPDPILVGLCSGAFHAIEAGLTLPVGAVCAINPVTNITDQLRYDEEGNDRPASAASVGPPPWLTRWAATDLAKEIEPKVPQLLWRLLDRAGVVRSPAAPLRLLAKHQRRCLLLCGDEEAEPYLTRAAPEIRRLVARGWLTMTVVQDSSHAMLDAGGQEQMRQAIDSFVRGER